MSRKCEDSGRTNTKPLLSHPLSGFVLDVVCFSVALLNSCNKHFQMVSWGPNQVFTLPGASNLGPGGAPAQLFGSPAPAPAPASGSLFGAPYSAPSGGLFGSPAPTPAMSGSLFGSAPSSGIFGNLPPSSTSGSQFGTPVRAVSSGYYGTLAPTTQQPQIPAQAALQAHMEASARQEAAKLQQSLEILHKSYAGTSHAGEKSDPFVCIVYNDMTPEQLQWYFAHSQTGSQPVPPKPPQVSENDWLEAVVRNPDASLYIPIALVGAEALQARLGWQQERANSFAKGGELLEGARDSLIARVQRAKGDVAAQERIHMGLRKRLLEVMRKVELVRCVNIPFQHEEINLMKRLVAMRTQVEQVGAMLESVQTQSPTTVQDVDLPDKTTLMSIFTGHHSNLVQLSEVVLKDKRDLNLLQERQNQQNIPILRH